MTPFDKLIEDKVKILISGENTTLVDKDLERAVQKRLREIKKNCTIVLKQLKENL